MLAAAADTQGMLLRGRYLLLGSELAIGTKQPGGAGHGGGCRRCLYGAQHPAVRLAGCAGGCDGGRTGSGVAL